MKLFKQRWYMVARKTDTGEIRIYSLGHVISLQKENGRFVYPNDFDPEEFFYGCYGVIACDGTKVETVELQKVIAELHNSFKMRKPPMPQDLCYIEGQTREDYLHDMRLCQRWAVLNRRLIVMLLMRFFEGIEVLEEFESIHNYIGDDKIIRKGSISAYEGERCIIPLNMRDGSLICTGKGNEDWNCSAPHGTGRVLSRSQAYGQITMEEFTAAMAGIYSESVNDFTRDESPMVYKPAQEIIENIGPTVNIDTIIRPIFNFKASK